MTAVTTRHRGTVREQLIDLLALAVLLGAVLVGFWPTFGGPSFLVAALGGILLGLAVAAVCSARGWGILLVTGLTVGVYFVFGGALALPHTTLFGVVPTLGTLTSLATGTVTAWKQLLTTVAPVSAADGHLLVPFLLALITAVTAASLALRLRNAVWALLPVIAALMLTIALGVPTPAFPLAQGIVIAAATTLWLSLRTWWAPHSDAVDVSQADPARTARMRLRRLLGGAIIVAIAAGAGVAVNAATAQTGPRQVFRDGIIPPFDVRDYASPLQSFRKVVRDEKSKTLFTVTGLPKDTRVRLAAMDAWDGTVYNVTEGGPTTSSAFLPLRSDMAMQADGVPTRLEFTIAEYRGVWLPAVAETDDIVFHGDRADDLRRSTYSNTATATTIVTGGVAEGDSYTLRAVIAPQPADAELKEARFENIKPVLSPYAPEALSAIAADAILDAETPIDQARALEAYFAEGGFFSHGLDADAVPSRAGHTAERIATMLGNPQMVGDDEQYAVAMALAASSVGMPARVVMGYYPKSDSAGRDALEITGDDVHAWVEIAFAGHGWVAFDPTPPEDKVPQDQNTKPRVDPKPQVLQPPPPPQEPIDLPPTVPDDRKAEDEKSNVLGVIGVILAIAGISLGILILLLSPFIVIGAWKAARRRSRRNARSLPDRISGGWDELTDRAVDFGAHLAPGGTRGEEAAVVEASLGIATVTALAERADGQVFGPFEPTVRDVDGFWNEVDEAVGGMRAQAGFLPRIKARLSLRSLRGTGWMTTRVQALKAAAASRRRAEPGNIEKKNPAESEN